MLQQQPFIVNTSIDLQVDEAGVAYTSNSRKSHYWTSLSATDAERLDCMQPLVFGLW